MDTRNANSDDEIQIIEFKKGSGQLSKMPILTGRRLFSRLKEWFPDFQEKTLKEISRTESIDEEDVGALTNLFDRIAEINANENISYSNNGLNLEAADCLTNVKRRKFDNTNGEVNQSLDEDTDDDDDPYEAMTVQNYDDPDNDDGETIVNANQFDNDDEDNDNLTYDLVNHLRDAVGLPPLPKPTKRDIKDKREIKISILTGHRLLEWLRDRFPHMSENNLQDISKSQAVNKNDKYALTDLFCRIVDKDESIVGLDEMGEESYKFPFIRCRLFPPKKESSLFDIEFDNLFRLANDDYLERYDLPNPPQLECVDYIYNSNLARQFEETRKQYISNNIADRERRLFHGTHHQSINPIITGNFNINANPVDSSWYDGRNNKRTKVMAYGAGVYFSDYPTFSLGYGKSLLLCRVLTGKEVKGDKVTGMATEKIYNTLRVDISDPKNDRTKIYVVKDTPQILPCYIIHMKQNNSKTEQNGVSSTMSMSRWFEHNNKSISNLRTALQPCDGTRKVTKTKEKLPGFESNSQGTITISYNFVHGRQSSEHPNPGQPYFAKYFPRHTYFPDNCEGNKIVKMLKIAFDRKLVFTIGRSQTTGADNGVVWNGIPHKTQKTPGPYGYPDPHYLEHVEKILSIYGITENDI